MILASAGAILVALLSLLPSDTAVAQPRDGMRQRVQTVKESRSAPGYLGQSGPRDVAWLDVTMNRGNSGGPVLVFADDPARDAVIGIANFSLNPFGQRAEEFANVAANFPGNAILIRVDFKKFSILLGEALASQSHGVGGCVAIDYLQVPKP